MTIKEMEALAGMTRANIRFYEKEGLLTPIRDQNGYRNYSNDDLEALKRIKLLRTLHISLEEIKALHKGEENLISMLDRHISSLELEQRELDRFQRVCREICNDGANYQTLPAQRYLDSLNRSPEANSAALASDIIPTVYAPWRRLLARSLDILLYSVLWSVFLMLVCNINIINRSAGLLDTFVSMALMLFIEPILLRLFGTTLGKWILGLRVTDNEDRRLSYSAAFIRTWTVLWRGMGLHLPAYQLVRQWKSYQAYGRGETLAWEYDSALSLLDNKRWRYPLLAGTYAAIFGMLILSLAAAEMPRHRGNITTAEFCDNFNRLSDYHGIDYGAALNKSGKWIEEQSAAGEYIFRIGGNVDLPDFVITETDGAVAEVSFHFETTDNTLMPPACQDQMLISAMAFACSQKDFGFFSKSRERMLETIHSHRFEDYSFSENGITIVCEVEYEGYEGITTGYLFPKDEAETTYYSLSFSMIKGE